MLFLHIGLLHGKTHEDGVCTFFTTAPNNADLRQDLAVEYVSCEPMGHARELFDEEYEPEE